MRVEVTPVRGQAESWFTIAALLLLTEPALFSGLRFTSLELTVYGVSYLAVYGVALGLLLRKPPPTWRVMRAVCLWTAICVALVSVTWSIAPEVSVRAAAKLLGAAVLGVYIASRYTLDEQLSLAWKVLGIAALACLVFSLCSPEGVHGGTATLAWKGVYHNRNQLGKLMVLLALASSLAVVTRRSLAPREGLVATLAFLLAVYLIHRSESKAALVLSVALLTPVLGYCLLRVFWGHKASLSVVALVLAGTVALVTVERHRVLALLGRDFTLSERTTLWESILPHVGSRPWLGYGYKSFWMNMEGPYRELYEMRQCDIWHAHNGYLDLLLDVGLLGRRRLSLDMYWPSSAHFDSCASRTARLFGRLRSCCCFPFIRWSRARCS